MIYDDDEAVVLLVSLYTSSKNFLRLWQKNCDFAIFPSMSCFFKFVIISCCQTFHVYHVFFKSSNVL